MKKYEIEALEKIREKFLRESKDAGNSDGEQDGWNGAYAFLSTFLSTVKPDEDEWRDISTAPKDESLFDVIGLDGNRRVDVSWWPMGGCFTTKTGYCLHTDELILWKRFIPPAPETIKE